MGLDEAEAGVWLGCAEDESCLVELGKAMDIGFQSGPGLEKQRRM